MSSFASLPFSLLLSWFCSETLISFSFIYHFVPHFAATVTPLSLSLSMWIQPLPQVSGTYTPILGYNPLHLLCSTNYFSTSLFITSFSISSYGVIYSMGVPFGAVTWLGSCRIPEPQLIRWTFYDSSNLSKDTSLICCKNIHCLPVLHASPNDLFSFPNFSYVLIHEVTSPHVKCD